MQIDQAVFVDTIKDINAMFEEAEEFDCTTFCESCLGYLTANLIYLCTDTKYDKVSTHPIQRLHIPNN